MYINLNKDLSFFFFFNLASDTGLPTCLGILRFISIHGELFESLAHDLTVWQHCTSSQVQSLGHGSGQMLLKSGCFIHSSRDCSKKICLHTTPNRNKKLNQKAYALV